MASYNKVILMGNLTRDPELQYLPSGTALCKFGIATNRTWTDKNSGEKKEKVCFVDLEAWQRTAEIVNEYCSKGQSIFIEGELEYNTWETEDGSRRGKHTIRVDRVQLIDNRENSDDQQSTQPAAAPPPGVETGQAADVTGDDIPF